MEEWGRLHNEDYIRVAQDDILTADGDTLWVSTVWLGIDHGFGMSELPVIFETMVFGGKDNQYCQRYCTEAEAAAGHTQLVVALIAGLRLSSDHL
jgi:hypothetical protein